MNRKRVLVASGSSAGHIFPALSFIDGLKEKFKDIDIVLILPEKNILQRTKNLGYQVKYIAVSPLKLTFDFKNLKGIFKLGKAFFETVFLFIDFQPDIVVGFGSLSCVPVILSAWLFRINTLIHEQNVIPGRANRLLAKFSDQIAISFVETKDYFRHYRKKIILTGNPLRKTLTIIDKQVALDYFGLDSHKFTILVMGGSLGSQRINREFLKFVQLVTNKSKIQIIHLCGPGDFDSLKTSYKDLDVRVKLFSFLEPMQYAYSASDLILSRAGATTIAEITYFKLPAIIIPYPYAYQHQLANARVLESKGCAIIIDDFQLNANKLKQEIELFINNPARLKDMRLGYNSFFRLNANDLLVNAVF